MVKPCNKKSPGCASCTAYQPPIEATQVDLTRLAVKGYGVRLLALMVGAMLGEWLAGELGAVVGSVALLVLSGFFIKDSLSRHSA